MPMVAQALSVGHPQPAGEVVLMPARGADDDRAGLLKPRIAGAGVPVLDLLADGLGFGLLAVLDGVVDDDEIAAAARDPLPHPRGDVAAAHGGLPLLSRRCIGREAEPEAAAPK